MDVDRSPCFCCFSYLIAPLRQSHLGFIVEEIGSFPLDWSTKDPLPFRSTSFARVAVIDTAASLSPSSLAEQRVRVFLILLESAHR